MIFQPSPSTLSSVNRSVNRWPVQLSSSTRAVAAEPATSILAIRTLRSLPVRCHHSTRTAARIANLPLEADSPLAPPQKHQQLTTKTAPSALSSEIETASPAVSKKPLKRVTPQNTKCTVEQILGMSRLGLQDSQIEEACGERR